MASVADYTISLAAIIVPIAYSIFFGSASIVTKKRKNIIQELLRHFNIARDRKFNLSFLFSFMIPLIILSVFDASVASAKFALFLLPSAFVIIVGFLISVLSNGWLLRTIGFAAFSFQLIYFGFVYVFQLLPTSGLSITALVELYSGIILGWFLLLIVSLILGYQWAKLSARIKLFEDLMKEKPEDFKIGLKGKGEININSAVLRSIEASLVVQQEDRSFLILPWENVYAIMFESTKKTVKK